MADRRGAARLDWSGQRSAATRQSAMPRAGVP